MYLSAMSSLPVKAFLPRCGACLYRHGVATCATCVSCCAVMLCLMQRVSHAVPCSICCSSQESVEECVELGKGGYGAVYRFKFKGVSESVRGHIARSTSAKRRHASCTPHARLMHASCTPHARLMHASCTPHARLMHASCTPQPHVLQPFLASVIRADAHICLICRMCPCVLFPLLLRAMCVMCINSV